ncbi:agamous-like MADS-box protein AGL80 [Solanum dulcamara]|uniref:agamous-like MADS-box protein AGL80 n=1 Tax=Solanum dulcamara TaxID=45834 RepID=UPI002486A95B|nr:agamous-like MADS-box protein AGL80 [Solanum dulcamara]
MAQELNAFHGVEIASVFYSDYHKKPIIYPNHAAATKIIKSFRKLSVQEQSKIMVTQEESVKQIIKKMKEELQKIRKENRFKELTNKMYKLKQEGRSVDMNFDELNDLLYVIKEYLKQIHELMKAKASEADSTSVNHRQDTMVH